MFITAQLNLICSSPVPISFPLDICVRFSLWLPETTCLLCLYVFIYSKCLESWAHGYVLVTGNFPSLSVQCKPPNQQYSILSLTISTLYSRTCDMACYFLSLLTWFPSFGDPEFHSCSDSVMRLWRLSNLPFWKYVIFIHSCCSGLLERLHIFIRVNIAKHGVWIFSTFHFLWPCIQ